MAFIGRLALLLLTLGAFATAGSPHSGAPHRLATSGPSFTVDGHVRFLVFISDFDALDSPWVEDDFDYLASRVDGVRIFANWWDFEGTGPCRLRFSPSTVIAVGSDGTVLVRPDRLARLKAVLDAARTRGLLVDLTFAAEPVEGLSALRPDKTGGVCQAKGVTNTVRWTDYAPSVGEVARALRGPAYGHVLFDLQNEAGHPLNGATEEGLRPVVDAARHADPDRLLTISSFDPDAGHQVGLVHDLGLAALNFHDWPRGAGWGGRTEAQVRKFRAALDASGLNVPIYAGEPDADGYGGGVSEFRDSLSGARRAGAAAWAFHTRAGHDLRARGLRDALTPDARRFLEEAGGLAGHAR